MPQRHKVLITGSNGMLGVDLSSELDRAYEVAGIDVVRSPRSIAHSFYEGDITDKKNISGLIKKIRPEIVIHSAAFTDVDGCERDKEKAYRINSDGTRNIALSCKEISAVLVYVSTDFVFDGRSKTPYTEEDASNPLSVYGDSKLKGEEAVKEILKSYFILRTSWLYGRNGKNFVDTILSKAKTHEPLKVVNDQVGSPTYTKDLASAIHKLLDKILEGQGARGKGQGIYHISNSGSVSWYEYAKEILALGGIKTEVIPISSEDLARPARRPVMSVLDNSKFVSFTGYKMRNWKEALKDYIPN